MVEKINEPFSADQITADIERLQSNYKDFGELLKKYEISELKSFAEKSTSWLILDHLAQMAGHELTDEKIELLEVIAGNLYANRIALELGQIITRYNLEKEIKENGAKATAEIRKELTKKKWERIKEEMANIKPAGEQLTIAHIFAENFNEK